MHRCFALGALVAAALLSACASPQMHAPAARSSHVQGSPLLANATDASLGLTFPKGQATKAQVLQNFGTPVVTNETANGGSRVEFVYSADTRNCNHRRTLTHTAVFHFDAQDTVTAISLRHGGQWY